MHLQDFHRNNMIFNTAVETSSYVNESLSSTENESNSAQSVIWEKRANHTFHIIDTLSAF